MRIRVLRSLLAAITPLSVVLVLATSASAQQPDPFGLGTGAQALAAAAPPAGFTESVAFSGLTNPTNLEFAPDGRVFVAEKNGQIKVFDNLSDPIPSVYADLRTQVHDFWDRGLLGLALDPAFTTGRPYVYALYAYNKEPGVDTMPRWPDSCPTPPGATADGCVISGRLSRLSGGTETVLIEDFCQQYPSHSVGDLAFGADGALYVSSGDGASFNFADYGQDGSPVNPCGDPPGGGGASLTPPGAEGGALRSQDVRTSGDPTGLDGSVLRVSPDTGAALPDNPAAGSADPNTRRIVAHGLRNPFRLTVKPGTSELWVGDVGWNTWEELNRITNPAGSVRNFGWPCYEGANRLGSYDNLNLGICENLYAEGAGAVSAPHYAWNHAQQVVPGEACPSGGSSAAGVAFYTGTSFPAAYRDALFFADYSRSCIWVMFAGAGGTPDPATRQTFASGATGVVDLEVGPDGSLYYADLNGGTIKRISHPQANRGPTARAAATPTSGQAPLTVSFDGTGSTDPDGDALTYAWDLDGDGAYDDSTASRPSFTYTAAGVVTARLRVTDAGGESGTDAVTITAGAPPTASIDSPAASLTWKVGDRISFSGSARDFRGASLPASALDWTVILNHCSRIDPTNCHTHAVQDFDGVASGSFDAPDHEYPSHLELRLTATDGDGLSTTRSLRLDPQTVQLTFATAPAGLQLSVGSDSGTAPITRTVIVGSTNSVSAPSPQTLSGDSHTFASWSDGGAQSHNLVAPAAATTYTATFERQAASQVLVGSSALQPDTDSNPAGTAEAFRTTAAASGVIRALNVYVAAGSTATSLVAGLYADNNGSPGARLTTGTLAAPRAGQWNQFAVPDATVVGGRTYWIAVLGPAGVLRIRDDLGGGRAETSAQANLTALPATWSTGRVYPDGPISATGLATGAALPPALAVTPGTLAFTATAGGANPAAKSLSVENTGGGALNFTASDDAGWLSVTPASGTAPRSLSVAVDATGLAAGTYTGQVSVTAGGASGSPKTIPVTLTVNAQPPPPPPPGSGLVGAWGFEEAGGDVVQDVSGSGNTGTVEGASRTASGRHGRALTFDGTDDRVTVPDAATLDLTTALTVEAWVYPTAGSSSWRTAVMKELGSNLAYALYASTDTGRPSGYLTIGSERETRGPAALPVNAWSHLAMTYDGANLRLYVNGTQVASRAQTGAVATSTAPLRFGGNAVWGEWFAGRIDEVRVYNRALTAAQIAADRDAPVGGGT